MFRKLSRLVGARQFVFGMICFVTVLLVTGIRAQSASPHEITVSAAISLKDAFEEIGKIFKGNNPGVKVMFNFAASGDLARHIEAGAPVDVELVYSTDAMVRSKEVRVAMSVPEGSHQPVVYPVTVIKSTKEGPLSGAFVDLVISTEGQRILNRYGFINVNLPR